MPFTAKRVYRVLWKTENDPAIFIGQSNRSHAVLEVWMLVHQIVFRQTERALPGGEHYSVLFLLCSVYHPYTTAKIYYIIVWLNRISILLADPKIPAATLTARSTAVARLLLLCVHEQLELRQNGREPDLRPDTLGRESPSPLQMGECKYLFMHILYSTRACFIGIGLKNHSVCVKTAVDGRPFSLAYGSTVRL